MIKLMYKRRLIKYNKEREYNSQYKLKQYHKRMRYAHKKLGGRCSKKKCRTPFNQLEIDHIDPKTKTFTFGSKAVSISFKKFKKELKKCQLLCKHHHKLKSDQEFTKYNLSKIKRSKHGTLNRYLKYRCRCIDCKTYFSLYKCMMRCSKKYE